MLDNGIAHTQITLGDPVRCFRPATVTGGSFYLQVAAGRWIVLCFPGAAADRVTQQKLAALFRDTALFDEDRLEGHVVVTRPFAAPNELAAIGHPGFSVLADYDGAVSRSFGATEAPRTIVLDPMLRAIANIAWHDAD